MSDNFFREIKIQFLTEAIETMQAVESFSLELEKNPNNSETLEAMFRLAHNFKGAGKAVGFDHISEFGHKVENLLVAIRNKIVPTDPDVIQVLLECIDRLNSDINVLQQDLDAKLIHTDEENKINIIIQKYASENSLNNSNSNSISHSQTHVYSLPQKNEVSSATNSVSAENKNVNSKSDLSENENKNNVSVFLRPPVTIEHNGTVNIVNKCKVTGGTCAKNDKNPKVSQPPSEDRVRVSIKKIEDILNIFGEQVILQSTLDHAKLDITNNQDLLIKTITQLSKLTNDLQQITLGLRTVNLKTLFSRLERTVRDTSKTLGKKIVFQTEGSDLELDKSIVENIYDPLNHMIRNSVDHGVEDPMDRLAKEKSETGLIKLKAFRSSGHFVIELSDDGKGLDKEKIFRKAQEKGIISTEVNYLDYSENENQIFNLIFENGFSTKEQVSEVSGRGVGMNVVKDTLNKLKGHCDIQSVLNQGTTFRIQLPLSLSIFNGLVISNSSHNENNISEKYVIPASDIQEVISVKYCEIKKISHGKNKLKYDFIKIRNNEIMPLLYFDQIFSVQNVNPNNNIDAHHGTVLIYSNKSEKIAFLVQEITGLQKIVHKPLNPELQIIPGAAGSTILGDGVAALILDLSVFIEQISKDKNYKLGQFDKHCGEKIEYDLNLKVS